MSTRLSTLLIILCTLSVGTGSAAGDGFSQGKDAAAVGLARTLGEKDRKTFLMNGNKITTTISNYGGIGPGYGVIRGVNNMVWRNLDYVFQFCPIVGASVPDARNSLNRIHIISDALWDYPGLREVNPTGDTLWQWQPLPGYADPSQSEMAAYPAPDRNGDGKPDSWPRSWYNPTLGKYVWPGYLSQDATSSDLECYWAMDDRFEFRVSLLSVPVGFGQKRDRPPGGRPGVPVEQCPGGEHDLLRLHRDQHQREGSGFDLLRRVRRPRSRRRRRPKTPTTPASSSPRTIRRAAGSDWIRSRSAGTGLFAQPGLLLRHRHEGGPGAAPGVHRMQVPRKPRQSQQRHRRRRGREQSTNGRMTGSTTTRTGTS